MKWKGRHDYLVLDLGTLKVSIMAEGRPVLYVTNVHTGHKLIATNTRPTLELAKKWCEEWLSNFALDIELALGDAFTGLGEMRYEPHPGECKVLAKGEYRGHKWFVVDTFGMHLCGYVTVPYWMNWKLASHAPCHGGASFLDFSYTLIAFQPNGHESSEAYLLGWDYNHAGDYVSHPDSRYCLSGYRWTTKEVAIEARKVIDWLVTRERKYSERYSVCRMERGFQTEALDQEEGGRGCHQKADQQFDWRS